MSCKQENASTSRKDGSYLDQLLEIFDNPYITLDSWNQSKDSLIQFNETDSNFQQLLIGDDAVCLSYLYQQHPEPIWIQKDGYANIVQPFLDALQSATIHGLETEDYGWEELNKYYSKKVDSLTENERIKAELATSHYYIKYSKDLLFGKYKPKNFDKEWHINNDSIYFGINYLIDNSANTKFSLDTFVVQNPRYKLLQCELLKWESLAKNEEYLQWIQTPSKNAEAIINEQYPSINANIKTYQYYNQLPQSGTIDSATVASLKVNPEKRIRKIKANLERLRWMSNSFTNTYIWASINQAELDFFRAGKLVMHTRTVVGAPKHQTPSILMPLQNVVVNPPWSVPKSIVKNEMNGRISSKYQVFNNKGERVPNSTVNIENYKNYRIVQPAGAYAALGNFKFNLPNKWNIYLHDTPSKSLFGSANRMHSHGCIRVQNPQQLAAHIFEPQGKYGFDKLSEMVANGKTVYLPSDKIPVYIPYMTTNADSTLTHIMYLKDVYSKDSALLSQFELKS